MSKRKVRKPDNLLMSEPSQAEDKSTVKVFVGGREIFVHEGTFVMALRKEGLRKQMIQELPALMKNGGYGVEEQTALIMFYPAMTACSSCKEGMFTPKEFLSLKELDIDAWYRVVENLNSHWFPKPDETEEDLKKKES